MEITVEKAKEIISKYEGWKDRVERGDFSRNENDYEQISQDKGYIDRYFWDGDIELCITTYYDGGVGSNCLSDGVYISDDDDNCEYFSIDNLRAMVG